MRTNSNKVAETDSRGFTLIEVLISMAITIVVMGAVFGLLTRGQRSFQREPQVADLQQSARTALAMISRDVLQAGAGLPPEFPSITPPQVDSTVGDQGAGNPDVLEVIGGTNAPGQVYADPEPLLSFDGTVLYIHRNPTSLREGDLVVVFRDDPDNADWMMGSVAQPIDYSSDLDGDGQVDAMVTLSYTHNGFDISAYTDSQLSVAPTASAWTEGLVTRVSVVRYSTQLQGNDLILMRQTDFGNPTPVGMVDDFQVVYMVGNAPAVEQSNPPLPHPADGTRIAATDIVSGIRVTVAARSRDENLAGSTTGASGDYIRKTFSSNISPRNISAGLSERTDQYQ